MTDGQFVGLITIIVICSVLITFGIGSAVWMVGSELDKTIREARITKR